MASIPVPKKLTYTAPRGRGCPNYQGNIHTQEEEACLLNPLSPNALTKVVYLVAMGADFLHADHDRSQLDQENGAFVASKVQSLA